MSKLRCILADDEPIARKILEDYIGELDRLILVKSCSNAMEVMETLQSETVDLLFLDINMPKLSGLELIKVLTKPMPDVIITTAYPNYAVEGFELSVTDYLLKPFSFERFIKAVMKVQTNKAERPIQTDLPPQQNPEMDSLFVKTDKKYLKLNFDEILYLEAYGNYVKVYTDKMILVPQTLSGLIEKLPNQFIRTHKSYCANIHQFKEVDGNQILLSNGQYVPIGASYRKVIIDRIQKS